MIGRTATKESTDHIEQWFKKEPWLTRWHTFRMDMLEKLSADTDLSVEALSKKAAQDGFEPVIFGAVFEHFLEQEFKETPHNVVEDYLKRRGWKETKIGRDYLKTLQTYPFSLYEVVDIQPGEWACVQDLIRPGSPVRVIEKAGTQNMAIMDHLVVKVVPLLGEHYLTGCIMKIKQSSAKKRVNMILDTIETLGLSFSEDPFQINKVLLSAAPDMFRDGIEYIFSPGPHFINIEGHDILAADIRFPVHDTKRVIKVLNNHPEFECADPGIFWNWVLLDKAEKPYQSPDDEECMIIQSQLYTPEGDVYYTRGSVELTPHGLQGSTLSKERADGLIHLLQELLGDALGKPTVAFQSVESMKADTKRKKSGKNKASDFSPEEEQEIKQRFLKEHYRKTLDEPLPMLNGKTPREAAKDESLQAEVIKWLRYLETKSQKGPSSDYDFGWIWEELGIADLKYATR